MEVTEREDGLFEDGTGRLFREVVEVELVLDAGTQAKLEEMSRQSGVPVSDLCLAAITDRLLREGEAGDADEA